MKYAVIKTGGKQYRVSEGDIIEIEQLPTDVDETVTFKEVLLYSADTGAKIGSPIVEGVTILGKVLGHVKGDKIRVSKFKSKVRHRRVTGHRQHLTRVKIESIGSAGEKTQKSGSEKTAIKKTEKTRAKATKEA